MTTEIVETGPDVVFERVIPRDIEGDSFAEDLSGNIDDDEPAEYICEICSDFFESQRGLNVHLGQKHKDRPDLQRPVSGRSRRTRTRRGSGIDESDYSGAPRIVSSSASSRRTQKFIVEEVNSFIVTGVSLLGVPDQMIDARIIEWMPGQYKSIKEIVTFSPREATVLAEGITRMQVTPVAAKVGGVVGPMVPYFFGLLACVVVVKHVADLVMLRARLAALNAQMQQAQKGQGQQGQNATTRQPQFI